MKTMQKRLALALAAVLTLALLAAAMAACIRSPASGARTENRVLPGASRSSRERATGS